MAAMSQKKEVKTYIFSNMENKGLHDAHQEENNRLNSFFFEMALDNPYSLRYNIDNGSIYDTRLTCITILPATERGR